MNKETLKQFLFDSNKAGYASGDLKKWIKESDNSITIPFEKGPWRSHDNFFGGEPCGGRIIVFFEGKPFWIMVYYGWVAETVETNLVYGILRKALIQMPKDYPYRGPREYEDHEYIYTNSWHGEVDRFAGEEQIHEGEKLIYKAHYMGGLVDQRRGV